MLIVSVYFSLSDTYMDFGQNSDIPSIESLTVLKGIRSNLNKRPILPLKLIKEFGVVYKMDFFVFNFYVLFYLFAIIPHKSKKQVKEVQF